MKEQMGNYLRGMVKVRIEGEKKERFMNLCKSAGIYIWNVEYKENYVFCISIADVYRLKPIIRKTKIHMHIVKKQGLPFWIYKYRKRKMFLPGVITGFLIVYFMSLYIWDLQVEGNYSYTDYELLKFLKENQVYWGVKKETLNCDQIEKDIRNEYFDITWVSVEVTGTRLIVHIKENENVLMEENNQTQMPGMESVPEGGYNIVAEKDCIIKSITMRNGTPVVKAEMQVKAGDILVYGSYDVINDSKEVVRTQYLTADADIYGKVVYTYEDIFPLKYIKKDYKQEKNHYSFRIGNAIYELGKEKKNKKNTDFITEEHQLSLYGDFYLPLYLMKNTEKSYEEKEYIYSEEQAESICKERFDYFLEKLEKNTIQIIENNVTIEVNGEMCICSGTIVVIEEVGTLAPGTIKSPQEEMTTG